MPLSLKALLCCGLFLVGQEFDLNLNDGLLNEEVKTYEAFSCGTSTFFEVRLFSEKLQEVTSDVAAHIFMDLQFN